MKDKEIRKILIEYLKASGNEIRIYQEKTIGTSVCDIMAVTDILTGYEIKSASDNYVRLGSQVVAYDRYFDRNFVVCGKSHIRSVGDRIPDYWGILCISENEVQLIREAKMNDRVDRRRQLSVLWKLELKNLLIKNNLPVYAQKEKGYIADRLAESVDSKLLGAQIAYELMHRDYSFYQAEDYTIHSDDKSTRAAFTANLPTDEIIDNLSEENLTEYTLDQWIAIYNKAKAVRERKTNIYQAEKPVLTPHEITYKDIEVSLGVPWVKPGIIDEFIKHLLGIPDYISTKYTGYEPITGNWFIENKGRGNDYPKACTDYGTERYNALRIIEASLNLREIKIYDNGNVLNERETLAALEKQEIINNEFKKWIWEDETRRWIVEEEYNKIFGAYKKKQYDGSKLEFPEMSAGYTLYDYQKDAVQKIISEKNTLLAFDVGAGKTYIMIAAAMKMRQMGLSQKNMFVVPNNIVGQWEKIFSELYPKAKILAVEPKTFKPEMRQKVLGQIKAADYDGIIIAYSCFEMIPLSERYIVNKMEKKTKELNEAIEELQRGIYWRYGSTPLYRQRDYIRKLTDELLDSMYSAPGDITFDQLEVNTLFLDNFQFLNENEIRIEGIFTDFTKDTQIFAVVENGEIPTEKINYPQRDNYSLNYKYGFNHNFKVTIPFKDNSVISFKTDKFDLNLDYNITSRLSKVGRYKLSKHHLAVDEGNQIRIVKKTISKGLKLEFKTMLQMIKQRREGWRTGVLLRASYLLAYPYMRKKRIYALFSPQSEHLPQQLFWISLSAVDAKKSSQ